MVLTNIESSYTFRGRGLGSIQDLTFVSGALVRRVNWQVSDHYTLCDHQAIYMDIKDESNSKQTSHRLLGSLPSCQ